MKRMWYFGSRKSHPRLAGVRLYRGSAVDVPEDLAAELMEEPGWNDVPEATQAMPRSPAADLSILLEPKPSADR